MTVTKLFGVRRRTWAAILMAFAVLISAIATAPAISLVFADDESANGGFMEEDPGGPEEEPHPESPSEGEEDGDGGEGGPEEEPGPESPGEGEEDGDGGEGGPEEEPGGPEEEPGPESPGEGEEDGNGGEDGPEEESRPDGEDPDGGGGLPAEPGTGPDDGGSGPDPIPPDESSSPQGPGGEPDDGNSESGAGESSMEEQEEEESSQESSEAGEPPPKKCSDENCAEEDCTGEGCTNCEDCEGCDECGTTVIAPTYIAVDGWARVFSLQDLRDALKAQEPRIQLGDDIQLDGGYVNITHNVTIDGSRDGGGVWTIRDKVGDHHFRAAEPDLKVTVQNLYFEGRNHFGVIAQRDYSGRNVHVVYKNVTYEGVQFAYTPWNGTLEVWDSTITIRGMTDANSMQEFCEATNIIFGGNVEIYRGSGNGSSGNSTIWTYSVDVNVPVGGVTILEGANVYIDGTVSYLFYRSARDRLPIVNFTVGDGATVEMITDITWHYGDMNGEHYLDNFIIGENASVTLRRTGSAMARLHLKDRLEVGNGSRLIVEDALPVILMRGPSSQIVFDNPAEIRLDHHILKRDSNAIQFSMTGKLFNHWSTNSVGGAPNGICNAPRGELITIAASGSSATASYTDEYTMEQVTSEQVDAFLPTNTANTLFVMAGYDLEPDIIYATDTKITGTMSPDATLAARYFPRDADTGSQENRVSAPAVPYPQEDTPTMAGFLVDTGIDQSPTGAGAFHPEEEVAFDLVRTIAKNSSVLAKETTAYAVEFRPVFDGGILSLVSVPDKLDFGVRKLPVLDTIYPLAEDAHVIVEDTRTGDNSVWHVSVEATALKDLSTGSALSKRSLGWIADGRFESLANPQVIWSGAKDEENPIQAKTLRAGNLQSGFAVLVDPAEASIARYQADITWTLYIDIL